MVTEAVSEVVTEVVAEVVTEVAETVVECLPEMAEMGKAQVTEAKTKVEAQPTSTGNRGMACTNAGTCSMYDEQRYIPYAGSSASCRVCEPVVVFVLKVLRKHHFTIF